MKISYTLDTNILINLQNRYPKDIFPALWKRVEDLVSDGRACICKKVFEELERGADNLSAWAKGLPNFVCDITNEDVALSVEISNNHPSWVQDKANEADPWLIAHGRNHSRCIVTEESKAGAGVIDKNQKVPNVAHEYNVEVLNFYGFIRQEGWTF